jgi:hypothetical protein
MPWTILLPRRSANTGPLIAVAAGAIGGLAVLAAFVLGLLSAPRVGDDTPTPTPTSALASPVVSAIDSVEVIEAIDDAGVVVYALIGLAPSDDSVWTAAFVEDAATGGVANRLLRVDIATGSVAAIDIPDAVGILSPPAVDGSAVWTGSDAGLHRIDVSGGTRIATLPVPFRPAELFVVEDGLWVAHDGGTSLVDRTGEVVRDITAGDTSSVGRVIGPPAFGSLWSCLDTRLVARTDPVSGETTTISLPQDTLGDCRGQVQPVSGVDGAPDGVIPDRASVLIDPQTNSIARRFTTGSPWAEFVVVDRSIWFAQAGGGVGETALVRVDLASGRPSRVLTFPGMLHGNATYDGNSIVVAGGWVWVLAETAGDVSSDVRPSIVRFPLRELTDPAG